MDYGLFRCVSKIAILAYSGVILSDSWVLLHLFDDGSATREFLFMLLVAVVCSTYLRRMYEIVLRVEVCNVGRERRTSYDLRVHLSQCSALMPPILKSVGKGVFYSLAGEACYIVLAHCGNLHVE